MKSSRTPLRTLLPVLVVALVASAGSSLVAQEDTSSLSYKPVQKWKYITPSEGWKPVTSGIPIAHEGGSSFIAEVDGHALAVDTNGDGKVDNKVKGLGGFLRLRAKDAQGQKFMYAVRFRKSGAAWQYATSGYMRGKVKGTDIALIDLNGNGIYNEVGVDGMVIGRGDGASFLSTVANLSGDLYEIAVTADGSSVTVKPFEGETGTLDARSELNIKGRLKAAIVSDSSGKYSFDLSDHKSGLKVPAGSYTLVSGYAEAGAENVKMRGGRMAAVKVVPGETTKIEWGAEVNAEFAFARSGEKITIEPSTLKFFDRAGVEWFDWQPQGSSPKFLVKDAKTGREIDSGRFGGC